MNRFKRALQTIAIVLTIQGLVTFSLFIFEESLQVATFGTWPAQDANDWHLVLEGLDLMKSINFGMKAINYSVGWIQPLAFFSYRAYAKSTDFYIKALEQKAFARAPEVFNGREITFVFKPRRKSAISGGYKYINRNIHVLAEKDFPLIPSFLVSGRVTLRGKTIEIHNSILSVIP